ncbi:MAG: hypothetical protein KC423_04565 [Anaerolineales bacterium]|nr:hypothetical protein [Anaerolineales bacterium]
MTQQTQEQRQKLRQQMEKHLELGDVKRLCFDLGVDYENLAGVTKGEKVIALLDHCDRRNKQSPLLLWLRQQHSHVSWQLTLTHDPNNPYKGLFAFQEADANRFFGREAESQRLEETVLANRFTAVVGSSGSGKSSLVLAGLLPRLGRRGNWHIAQLRPEKTPLLNLAHALVPMLQPDTDAINEPARARELAGYLQSGSVPLADYVHQLQATNHHLLLIIDQFEELYTQVSDGEQRHRFLDLLLAALQAEDGHAPTVLITMRADFMGQALGYAPFVAWLQDNDFLLGPMGTEALRQTIEQPLAGANVGFEAGLVTRILQDVGDEPGNLPLLQFGLTQLWDQAHAAGTLTHDAYEAIGRIEGALANHADAVFADLDEASQAQTRHLFTQLVQPGAGTEDTRRLARRSDLVQAEWRLVQQLADARLVVTGEDGRQQETIEVVHEALIRQWQRLRDWMSEDRLFRSWQERLRDTIALWETNKQDEGYLLRGAPLAEAEGWLLERPALVTAVETAFITTCTERRNAQAADQEAQRQRELEMAQQLAKAETERAALIAAQAAAREAQQQQDLEMAQMLAAVETERAAVLEKQAELEAKSSWRLRRLLTGVVTLLVIAVFAMMIASQQSRVATARGLSAQASLEVSRQNNLHTAALLALEANRLAKGEGNAVFTQIARQPTENALVPQAVLDAHSSFVFSVAWSPDGEKLASASAGGAVVIWNTTTWEQLTVLLGHSSTALSMSWSPDGDRLASASADGAVVIWNTTTWEQLTVLLGHSSAVWSMSWSPDGDRLASASNDHTVVIWNTATWEQLTILLGHSSSVLDVAWSPDGRWLASASDDRTMVIWNTATWKQLTVLLEHSSTTLSMSWSPDGEKLASASDNRTVVIWNTATWEQLTVLQGHSSSVLDVAWSPNGDRLASASHDSSAVIWNTATWEQLTVLQGHSSAVLNVVWSPDGERLASASDDQTIVIWQTATWNHLTVLQGHLSTVLSVTWSPDGKQLASASNDRTVIIWNTATWEQLTVLQGHSSAILNVAWSPDGERLASASDDQTIVIWQTATWNQQAVLQEHVSTISSVAWSPNGERLASASADGTVMIWNTTTWNQMAVLQGHSDYVLNVAWSPSSPYLASASADGTVRIWNTATWNQLTSLRGHSDWIRSIAWSPDGDRLASASADGAVVIWNTPTWEQLTVLKGHESTVLSVAWSPDGERLASASSDSSVVIWDTATWQPLTTLAEHSSWVYSVAWSNDGEWLASASGDRTVFIWPDRFAHSPCNWLETNLTLKQWQLYRPNALYRSTCPNLPAPSISWERNGLDYVIYTLAGRIWAGVAAVLGLGLLFWLGRGLGRLGVQLWRRFRPAPASSGKV